LKETHAYAYHEWNPVEEIVTNASTSVTETKRYVWGIDLSSDLHGAGGAGGLLAMSSGVGTYLYAYDGNGNVRALVKADAANPAASAIAARYAYDGFGKEVVVTGADADKNAFRFSTKQLDGETGMNYYGYRYYSADAGRWINRDPAEEDGGIGLYNFVGNESTGLIDILGLTDNMAFMGAGDAYGNAVSGIPSDPGTYSVGVHGGPGSLGTHQGVNTPEEDVDVNDLADSIVSDPSYKPGTPIDLRACHSAEPKKNTLPKSKDGKQRSNAKPSTAEQLKKAMEKRTGVKTPVTGYNGNYTVNTTNTRNSSGQITNTTHTPAPTNSPRTFR
jgi:RHS repeat-associated protein